MIIYGSRATQLAKETISDPCPHCQSSNTLDLYVFQRYAHIFWIPFFPIGKTGVCRCAHCKQALKPREMPSPLRSAYTALAGKKKAPVWTFTGIALIGVLIIGSLTQSGRHDARTSALVKAPQAGDILEVKKSAGVYTLYKIAEVRPDSVAVLPLLYSVDNPSGLSKLESGSYGYAAEPKMYSRENLSVLVHAGEILDVIRK
jgi:hypothetical protein